MTRAQGEIGGARRTRRILRAAVLAVFLAGVVAGGYSGWMEYEEPIRAAARDYLSYRRLDRHAEALLFAADESGVDPYLLAGVAAAESGGRLGVVSSKGAMGLFQLSRVTAEWRARELGLPPPTDEQLLSDPELNARLGANNMAWLLETYDGDELRALCAYNAGARKLKTLTEALGGWEAWRAQREADGKSPILAYAQRVLRYRDEFRERGLFVEENGEQAAGGGG